MFDLDRWQEIFGSIRSNVLRTVLSGFTVALGLFIFIVLFGIGTGLQNAFTQGFSRDAQNLIYIMTGKTTEAYAGLQSNRTITLNNSDYDAIINKEPEKVEYATPRYDANWTVKYGKESGMYQIKGSEPGEIYTEDRQVLQGRYLSPLDLERKQNVAVIGRMVQRDLIKDGSPIGKELDINGTIFKVIGVFSDNGGDWDERQIAIPISAMQLLKKNSDTITTVELAYNPNLSAEEAIKYGDAIKDQLKKRKKISPDDESGVTIWNNAKNMKDTLSFMAIIGVIVLVIGMGTLIAGVIGISNIMVYIVKERTKEIGVRKAIGARPQSIVGLILQESIVITALSGLIGIGIGVLALKMIGNSLEEYFIIDPGVGWGLIFFAFICLIIAGMISGFVPAYRASKIKPIEALRDE